VCLEGRIWYTIIFDYEDPEKEYYELLLRGGEDLRRELKVLKENMQKFLNEEKMLINGEEVKATVRDVWIEVRGDPQRPSLVFLITIPFRLPGNGRMLYEDYYEEERAEYDYVVHWIFPSCIRILDYSMPGKIKISPGRLDVFVKKGTKIPGYESILFDASTCGGR
jgi:hypothetical protein